MDDEASTVETREPDVDIADKIAIDQLPDDERAATARSYLEKRMQLLTLEVDHFDLRRKSEHSRLLTERLKIAMQVLFIIAGVIVVGSLGTMMWWASRSENVVVEAFDVPPDLAQRGATGRAVAGILLDELDKLQTATRGNAAKLALKSAWTSDIKIDVPETGVSLGELQRVLRDNLGHDQHVSGTVVEQADGSLSLSVRGDDVRPKTFSGPPADLAKLVRQAAEYVYGEAQPYLYGVYLVNASRFDEAIAFLAQAYPRVSDKDRPNLANTWGLALQEQGHWREAEAKYRLALMVNPHFWKSWGNLINMIQFDEGEEAAFHSALEMRAAAAAAKSEPQPTELQMMLYYSMVQDVPAVMRSLQADATHNNGRGTGVEINGPQLAEAEAARYNFAAAEQFLAASDPDDPTTAAETLAVAAYRAINDEDYGRAVAPTEALDKMTQSSFDLQFSYSNVPCYVGLVYGMTGRGAEAEAAFKRGGRFVQCYAYRARVFEHNGDWGGAVTAYRAAIALTPSLPYAYDIWGEALARRGDLYGAIAAFGEANKRGPHWADPLKHWGDALVRQHRIAEAHAKYAEALAYAPEWPELKAAAAKTAAR